MRLLRKILLFAMLFGAGYVVRAWIRYESSIPAPRVRTASALPVSMSVPQALPKPAPAPEPPAPAPPATFSLVSGDGLTLHLSGRLPPGDLTGLLRERIASAVPELVEVKDRIEIDPAVASPDWLPELPELAASLVGSVRDPGLTVTGPGATISGSSDDKMALTRLRNRFHSLFGSLPVREEALAFDAARPAPETRMPLVFYLGPEDGRYLVAASVPTVELRESIGAAMREVVGGERFTDHIRVSPATVEEDWMKSLPEWLPLLLAEKNGAMELVVVDRGIELKGDLPDEDTRKSLIELFAPAKRAGYGIKDGLRVK